MGSEAIWPGVGVSRGSWLHPQLEGWQGWELCNGQSGSKEQTGPGGQGKGGWGKGGELFPEQLCEQVEEVLVSRRPDRTKVGTPNRHGKTQVSWSLKGRGATGNPSKPSLGCGSVVGAGVEDQM